MEGVLVIMNKLLFCAALFGVALSVQATVLFQTDFLSTPPGFKAASDAATARGADDTLVVNNAPSTSPKDTVIDGCTLSAPVSSGTTTMILISKGSQACIKVGDTAGCTPGRLSIKNTGGSITLPQVTGPCTLTYYAAASSATAGRGVMCIANGSDISDAGIPELMPNGVQATVKEVYADTATGPIVFTLSAMGGIYLYDIIITSGATASVKASVASRKIETVQKVGDVILNGKNALIDIYAISGAKLLSSNKSTIDLHGLTHGVYMVRMEGMNEQIKIVR